MAYNIVKGYPVSLYSFIGNLRFFLHDTFAGIGYDVGINISKMVRQVLSNNDCVNKQFDLALLSIIDGI